MTSLFALFVLVFLLNVLPAFAPPTWMLLSFFGLRFPEASPFWVALVAASAATAGRTVLAYFAKRISASRWFPEPMRANLDSVAKTIERRRATSSLATVGDPVLRGSLRELRVGVFGRRRRG